jgi:hypothetical protein
MGLQQVEFEDFAWIRVTQITIQKRSLVNTTVDIGVE